jgi:hypothetical protein
MALVTLFVVSASCSKPDESDSVATYPVKGKVTVGGKPAAGAVVRLHSTTPGPATVTPQGIVAVDGSVVLRSYQDNDGAPEGEYRATVVWIVDAAGMPVSERDESGLPDKLGGRYRDAANSSLTVKVTANGENTFELPLK